MPVSINIEVSSTKSVAGRCCVFCMFDSQALSAYSEVFYPEVCPSDKRRCGQVDIHLALTYTASAL